jgi:hypothetical protein
VPRQPADVVWSWRVCANQGWSQCEVVTGAAQHGAASVGGWILGQGCGTEVRDQRAERDVGLNAGQWCAIATVDAAAEAEVLVVGAGRVEPVGVAKPLGITVGGGRREYQTCAHGDGGARDVDAGQGSARYEVDRRLIAQQFFHRGGRTGRGAGAAGRAGRGGGSSPVAGTPSRHCGCGSRRIGSPVASAATLPSSTCLDSGGLSYGGYGSSPTTVSEPVKPSSRSVSGPAIRPPTRQR